MVTPHYDYLKAPKFLLATHQNLEHEHLGHLIGTMLVLLPAHFIKNTNYNSRIQLYPEGFLR